MTAHFTLSGHLSKMAVSADENGQVSYEFRSDDKRWPISHLLGKTLSLDFSGEIHCQACGRATRKSFSQGFCYPCFTKLARCDTCIMSPEKCHLQEGTCREPDWAASHCQVPHIVYLANSSGLKVGITRETQIPTRWIDQGASQALPLFRVPERRISGLVETTLKNWVSDRTHWQRLLKGEPEPRDMAAEAEALLDQAGAALEALQQSEGDRNGPLMEVLAPRPREFRYPVLEYPAKVKSLNPEKQPRIEGTLLGIKGQYLILDTGCLNIRKYTAYFATLQTY